MLFDEEFDGAGTTWPAMLREARKRLKGMAEGRVLRLFCDDPAAKARVPELCEEDGHELVGRLAREDGWLYFIRKG